MIIIYITENIFCHVRRMFFISSFHLHLKLFLWPKEPVVTWRHIRAVQRMWCNILSQVLECFHGRFFLSTGFRESLKRSVLVHSSYQLHYSVGCSIRAHLPTRTIMAPLTAVGALALCVQLSTLHLPPLTVLHH